MIDGEFAFIHELILVSMIKISLYLKYNKCKYKTVNISQGHNLFEFIYSKQACKRMMKCNFLEKVRIWNRERIKMNDLYRRIFVYICF